MSTPLNTPVQQAAAYEWPTWLLWLTIMGSWLLVVGHFARWPLWLSTPVLILLGAWYMSLQHELTHGHPTRNATINRLLGLLPLAVWYPFDIYKTNHLIHHNDPDLTLPDVDTESNYVSRAAAQHLSPVQLWLKRSQRTVLGRVIIGPALVILELGKALVQGVAKGDFSMVRVAAVHVPLLFIMLWGLAQLGGISPAYYCFVVGYFALGVAMLRSLYEHRPAALPEHRTVVNEASLFWRLLYLNNNYHVVHHAFPGLAWYRIPAVYRAHRAAYQEHNGAFVLPGYLFLIRRFAWRPVDSTIHEEAFAQAAAGGANADLAGQS